MAKTITTSRADLKLRSVAGAVFAQVWPLVALVLLLQIGALALRLTNGDTSVTALAWWFTSVTVLGLLGSYALHECAHAVVLRRVSTVTQVTIERTWTTFSIRPHGAIGPRQQALVAIVGPGACGAAALLWLLLGQPMLAVIYSAHLAFLLPIFGDGRALVSALVSALGARRRSGSWPAAAPDARR